MTFEFGAVSRQVVHNEQLRDRLVSESCAFKHFLTILRPLGLGHLEYPKHVISTFFGHFPTVRLGSLKKVHLSFFGAFSEGPFATPPTC